MGLSYSQGLRRFVVNCPVTAAIIVVAALLYIAVNVLELRGETEAMRQLGAVSKLIRLRAEHREDPLVPVPQLYGLFELWDGQWWRILVSAFHHSGLLHLTMNSLALAGFGWLLEPRMGWWKYLVFFLAGTMISMLPEFLMENQAVGLSGGICALFGALIVLRKYDWEVAEMISPAAVQFGLAWLVGCVVATQLNVMQIANAAHFTGLIYGWLAGQVLFGRFAPKRVARWSFVAAHLLLIPATYFAVHPIWIGRYWWYQADIERDLDKRTFLLRQAVERDPSLRFAWDELAEVQVEERHYAQAWQTVVEGLYHNRSNEHGVKLARDLWKYLTVEEQQAGRETVRKYFADDNAAWEERLQLAQASYFELLKELESSRAAVKKTPPREPGVKQDLAAPPVNPTDPGSAAEGFEL